MCNQHGDLNEILVVSHASLLRNEFSAYVVTLHKLLNAEGKAGA